MDALRGMPDFAREMAHIRNAHNLTQDQLAESMGFARSYVANVENGNRLPSQAFTERLDGVLHMHGMFTRMRARLLDGISAIPEFFVPYAELEERATHITDFSAFLVMGMLQSRDYAAAIYRAANPDRSLEWIEPRLEKRLSRVHVLSRHDPLKLWCILDESVIRRRVGSRATMRGQVQHLLDLQEQYPTLTLQVLPFDTDTPAAGGSFTGLVVDGERQVYFEAGERGTMHTKPLLVERGWDRLDRLRAMALSPGQSITALHDALGEI